MPSTGLGLRTHSSPMPVLGYGTTTPIIADYLFGLPPAPVWDVPYLWLRMPLALRQDGPINDQRVSQTGGVEYRSRNQTSLNQHSTWAGSAIELDTSQSADPKSLATHITGLHTDARNRAPKLTFDLLDAAKFDAFDLQLLLARTQGDRILITDSPSTWPPGMERLTIEGVRHERTSEQHLLTWNTSPMDGDGSGDAGPWFQLDVSPLGYVPIPF